MKPDCLRVEEAGRRAYHLSIFRDAAAEFSELRNPKVILESFLLSAQGGTGAREGFAALMDKQSDPTHLIVRGDFPLTGEQIRFLLPRPGRAVSGPAGRFPTFLEPEDGRRSDVGRNLHRQYPILLSCPLEGGRQAILGLAPALHGRDYDLDDRQLVMHLAFLFQISLTAALSSTQEEMLLAELRKRNAELDRQVFLLNGIRDLAMEAGESIDVEKFLSVFLPTLMGRFFRHQGLVLIRDRASGTTWFKSMGIDADPIFDSAGIPPEEDEAQPSGAKDTMNGTILSADHILFLCLAGVQEKHLQPLQVESVLHLDALSSLIADFIPETGFLFLVREQMYGALLLGPPLEEKKISDQEKELMFAFVTQSVLHLKNADSFAAITALNQDLEKQNLALKQTIDELTHARHRISVLESAARRIAVMVHRNAEKLMQVRPLDFILIFGISIVLGLAFNFQNPKGIPLVPLPRPEKVQSITVSEAQDLLSRENALLIDARPREFYEKSHAWGAENVPPELFDAIYAMRFRDEDPDRPLIIYGRTFSRLYDEIVARKFFYQDHERIYLFEAEANELPTRRESQ